VNTLVTQLDTVGVTSFATKNSHEIFNAYLVVQNQKGDLEPWLSSELPSLDNGTIKLNDDGSMETTYALRKNIKWHDGTQFTADDVVFGWKVQAQNDWPLRSGQARNITAIDTPDPYTLVMTWRSASMFASQLVRQQLDPLPRHRLEKAWEADPTTFPSNPYFREVSEFVGTGPFRPIIWEKGSFMTAQAYDDYFLGRPMIDRVTIRFIADARTIVANLMSGTVDVVNGSMQYTDAMNIQQQWKSGKGGEVMLAPTGFRHLLPQFRPEEAKPVDVANDVRVRRAMMYSLNRVDLAEVTAPGNGEYYMADSYAAPGTPLRDVVDPMVPHYRYDPNRAAQLLSDAGWVRGNDGVLTKNGERFEIELRAGRQAEIDQIYALMQQNWKGVGIALNTLDFQSTQNPVDYAVYPGVILSLHPSNKDDFYTRYQSSQIATAANRYSSTNGSAYASNTFDRAANELMRSIRITDIQRNYGEAQRILFEDVGAMPMYFGSDPLAVRAGVSGIIPSNPLANLTYRAELWDVQ